MITTDKIRKAGIEQLFNASSFRETIPPRHYKRTMRHMRGQWMEITDRREQYYTKRKVHDDAHNLQAKRKFRIRRPAPYVSQRERLIQAQKEYNENYRKFVDSAEINKAP